MAYDFAHDVVLQGSSAPPVAFLMYPQAETADGRIDCLDPDGFRYEITSREIGSGNLRDVAAFGYGDGETV